MKSLFNRIFAGRPRIYQQRKWTPEQLRAQGFTYYESVKQVTMARRLPPEEAPKIIKTPWDTLVAGAGYYIAYRPGNEVKESPDDYEPRPIEPEIFEATYAPWNEPDWKPTPAEAHLIQLGCKPYYKTFGVWAKKLKEPTYVQSVESSRPSVAPAGTWLCVGYAGEPWYVTEEWFMARYVMPNGGNSHKP